MRRPLVVPRKGAVRPVRSHRRRSAWHVHSTGRADAVGEPGRRCQVMLGLLLPRMRELVPHVHQRLLVHFLMLEDRPQRLRVLQQRVVVALQVGPGDRVRDQPIRRRDVVEDDAARGPGRVSSGHRGRLGVGIDPARKDRFQGLIDPWLSQAPLDQRVDGEGRQVPFIEDDRVSQGDRPLVVGRRVDQVEERPRTGARPTEPFEDQSPFQRHSLDIIADATRTKSSAYLDLPRMSAVR